MEKIRVQESDQIKAPQDRLEVNMQLTNSIEQAREYLEDPDGVLASTNGGLYYRMKLRVTLNYKQTPG
jgi:Bardet-Biedl syndrome 9 protein